MLVIPNEEQQSVCTWNQKQVQQDKETLKTA